MPPETPRMISLMAGRIILVAKKVGGSGRRVVGVRAAGRSSSSGSTSVHNSLPAFTSRSAMDSGFSWTVVSTNGPTWSSRPSPSWE